MPAASAVAAALTAITPLAPTSMPATHIAANVAADTESTINASKIVAKLNADSPRKLSTVSDWIAIAISQPAARGIAAASAGESNTSRASA